MKLFAPLRALALCLTLLLPALALCDCPCKDAPACCTPARETPLVKLAAQVKPSVVCILHDGSVFGAGFVADSAGYLVTCAHCTQGKEVVKVRLADGRELKARVILSNKDHDIAVLKVEAKGLKAVKIPPVDDVMIGETVFTIGHPEGDCFTTSKGIVSALNRTIPLGNGQVRTGLVQTDCPINGGNSGGPLVNMAGELAGMISAGYSGRDGLAYAVGTGVVREYLNVARQKDKGCGGGCWLPFMPPAP